MTETFAQALESENVSRTLEDMIEKENWTIHSVQYIGARELLSPSGKSTSTTVTKVFVFASRYLHA